MRGDERSPAAHAPSADEHPGRLAARLRLALALVMVRQAFEQLRVTVGDAGGDLLEQIRTIWVTEVGQGQVDLYAISGVP